MTQEGHSLYEEMRNDHPLANCAAQTESRKGLLSWEDQGRSSGDHTPAGGP